MKRNQLSDLAIFVEVARANGFRAAADSLKLKAGSVSEAVQRFENRLGVRLFERSTRSVVLTPAGQQLFERSRPAITDLENAVRDLQDQKDRVSGTLRLSAPYSAGPFFLNDLVAGFAISNPDVSVEVLFDDRKVDLVDSHVDAAIRAETLLEPDTHAVAVGPVLRMAIVASPQYLEVRGVPRVPADVLGHDGICFAFGRADRLAPWMFDGAQGPFVATPRPRVIANDLRSLVCFAESGLGLAYVYAEVVSQEVTNGALVEVLQGCVRPLPRYSINYRTKKHMPRRLRAFIDQAKAIG